ncbi:MAG: flavin reductase [Candidatus Izemoplasmatales bacterium]|nr:flavin reductase [Candidatus Izemoplasmatales bacterium]
MTPILLWIHPVPIVLVGTKMESGNANFTTIGDIAVAGLRPPLIMISFHERHCSRMAIDQTRKFSVHVVEPSMMAKVDLCGSKSGHHFDKSTLFDFSWHQDLPIIKESPIVFTCHVRERLQVEQRVIYVAQVHEVMLKEGFDLKDIGSLETLLYGLDNHYYRSGGICGSGYQEHDKLDFAENR